MDEDNGISKGRRQQQLQNMNVLCYWVTIILNSILTMMSLATDYFILVEPDNDWLPWIVPRIQVCSIILINWCFWCGAWVAGLGDDHTKYFRTRWNVHIPLVSIGVVLIKKVINLIFKRQLEWMSDSLLDDNQWCNRILQIRGLKSFCQRWNTRLKQK